MTQQDNQHGTDVNWIDDTNSSLSLSWMLFFLFKISATLIGVTSVITKNILKTQKSHETSAYYKSEAFFATSQHHHDPIHTENADWKQ